MNRPMRLLALPVDTGGCGWYRVRQPFEMIQRFTPHDAHIISHTKDDMVELVEALRVADVVVARPGSEEGMFKMMEYPEFKHLKWVMDIDDNIDLISPYSNHYEEYGVFDFYDENIGAWLWKDGERGFDIQRNKKRMDLHKEGLKRVDLVTCTTPKLADYARHFNKNVAVLPNMVNFERWWKLDLKPNKTLRIGWAGGSSHYEDLFSVKKPLNQLMKKYKFDFYFVGHSFPGVIDKENKKYTKTIDWVPFKGHSYRTMALALDIAVIPLVDLPFNHFKSPIKWYEMSAMGVPTVVSNITPYKEEIKHGKNALGYSTPEDFYNMVEMLIKEEKVRENIGENARKWVNANRSARDNINLWEKAYSNLL